MTKRAVRDVVPLLAVAVLGVVVVALVAATADVPVSDAIEVAGIGAGTAILGCTAGVLVLSALRRRSLAAQIAATAVVVLLPVAVGAWVAAQAMFLSDHDLTTLAVILVAAGTVG
ncbi:MAG TPA: hypothetical protein VHS03_03675, partial [Gaiellaceae bacterium]|nr:hypothetical protein [Gaiellaceae bacterium]